RRRGTLPLLVVQGVVSSPLTEAADIVLPGSAWVEKDSTYTNDQGRVQASAQAFEAPGDALDDREILFRVARAIGTPLPYTSPAEVRAAIAEALRDRPGYAGLAELTFARPVPARHWLQASNPSERWKWDFMFQEVNVRKWEGLGADLPQLNIIPLLPILESSTGEEQE
ncbi:MAG TPA: molybdopterin-dependent oxidoreductase, partial [Methylomirabilota bacterium]